MWTFYTSAGLPKAPGVSALYVNTGSVTITTDAGPTTMASGNVLRVWNSATGGTQTAPTAAGTNNIFTIIDVSGTISQGSPITFTPASGTVQGASVNNNKLYIGNSQRTWVDGPGGWALQG